MQFIVAPGLLCTKNWIFPVHILGCCSNKICKLIQKADICFLTSPNSAILPSYKIFTFFENTDRTSKTANMISVRKTRGKVLVIFCYVLGITNGLNLKLI